MNKEMKIVAIFSGLAAFQIAWHFFLMGQNSFAEAALRLYLLHNDHSRKGVSGWVDMVMPTVVIGLLIGRIGWEWSIGKSAVFVIGLTMVLVVLKPLYARIITPELAWWWPKTEEGQVLYMLGQIVRTLILLTVCVLGGRDWHKAKSSLIDNNQKDQTVTHE
jgi:hypothetical protein